MKRRPRTQGHAAAAVLLATGLGFVGSCYRAEIDLGPLLETMAGGAGTGGGSAAPVDGGQAGELSSSGGREQASGASGAESAGNGASSAHVTCDDGPLLLDLDDQKCSILGVPPTRAECAEQPKDGWEGCYDGGCTVCTKNGEVPGYPYYFNWHPCCRANDTCSNHSPMLCNARCPKPTERDRKLPCGVIDPNPG